MNESLRQRARELGFDDCRVTTANAPESAARFKEWLADGRHGEMSWIERNAAKRVDPQQVLPGTRSLITLAASYAIEGRGARGESRRRPKARAQARAARNTRHATRSFQVSSPAMRVTTITTTSSASVSSSLQTL